MSILLSHAWRVLLIPVHHIIIGQYYYVAFTITFLQSTENRYTCLVQFYPWFKFYFPFVLTSYPKTKGNKIQTKDKIEPQHTQEFQ